MFGKKVSQSQCAEEALQPQRSYRRGPSLLIWFLALSLYPYDVRVGLDLSGLSAPRIDLKPSRCDGPQCTKAMLHNIFRISLHLISD